MPPAPPRPLSVLFVDDEPDFLATVRDVFGEMSAGRWQIHTSQNQADALSVLGRHHVDVAVLDLKMPVMDGLQFLPLVQRTHPNVRTVILTGAATEDAKSRALSAGASLFLEKLQDPHGFESIFAAIEGLGVSPGAIGFQGMMRRVGLQEVLQLECLGRKSSILEVFTGRLRGRIYISDGSVVHAEAGNLQGEMALYTLLALRGGGFNLLPYRQPDQRTIVGHWEFLLMEGARLADEGNLQIPEEAVCEDVPPACPEPVATQARDVPEEAGPVEVSELLLCSGGGEILHVWNCEWVEYRRMLLRDVELQARELLAIAPLGGFEQLEITSSGGTRIVCQARMDRQLFVRTLRPNPTEGSS